jgi:hypothetical protein
MATASAAPIETSIPFFLVDIYSSSGIILIHPVKHSLEQIPHPLQ